MYKINNIKTTKIDKNTLITNDYGNWVLLDEEEYKNFKFEILTENLKKKLEQNNIIITRNNLDQLKNQINYSFSHITSGAGLHIIIPTLRCNFTCKYCYALRASENAIDKDMTIETAKKTVEFIMKSAAKNLTIEFSGGEPLLRFDIIKEVVIYSLKLANKKNKSIKFAIITNASLINQEMIDFFKKYNIGICISLDGPKKIHDENRIFTKTKKGTYDEVIKKIKQFKENKIGINSLPVIVKNSLENWKEIVDEYIKQGFFSLRFKYISNFGFANNSWEDLSYTPEEYLKTWKKVIEYMLELNKKEVIITENLTTIFLKKILKGINTGYAELQSPCGAVITQLVYDHDGKIYTCDEARTMPEFEIGNVFTSTHKDLLEHETTKTMQTMSNLITTCEQCPWSSFCGICPLEIYKQEKGFITNIPSNYRCKIHKGMFEYLFEKITKEPETKKLFEKWILIEGGIKGLHDEPKKKNPFKQ